MDLLSTPSTNDHSRPRMACATLAAAVTSCGTTARPVQSLPPLFLFHMFTVYVIRSERGIRYIGFTEDLPKRLGQHNTRMSRFTSRDFNWKLVYKEEYSTRAEAMSREKWLKSGVGREFLDRIENELSSGS